MRVSKLLIVGAGGFGRAVSEAAELSNEWPHIDFLDDSYPNHNIPTVYNVVGCIASLPMLIDAYDAFVVAIGSNKLRREVLTKLINLGANIVNIYHPKAIVSAKAIVGLGTIVMAGAVIGTHAVIGNGCILNSNAVADHDTKVDDFGHLGVGALMPGMSYLMEGAWLRAGVALKYGDVVPKWEVIEENN